MKKAVLYARYSTDNQNEKSIEDQFRACERIAALEDLTVVCRFEDRGISGGTADRPGYQALLGLARSVVPAGTKNLAAFDVIICEDISRLWRSRSEYGPRSAELEDLGIHLVTGAGDDTRRDGWGLVLGIKSALAEYARKEISYRTKRGLEGKALAGSSTGGRCYGYSRPGVISEDQAHIVRAIYDRAGSGMSAKRIADYLNADGIPALAGGQWNPSSVDRILRNVRYTGRVIYGRQESTTSAANSRHKRRTARKGGPIVSRFDAAVQIVSQELFDQVQQKRACNRV